ncbi:MAG: ribosomal protein S18-alanine N-acetyltransferase [Chloroflexi bacterium]|nr:ribosomal protein S18-alanine N-acetyltransferase [Chloroflexota bacterium]
MNLTGLPYTVEPMLVDDIPTVSAVEQSVFTMPWSSTAFEYELRHNPSSCYMTLRYLPWKESDESEPRLSRSVRRLLRPVREDIALLGYGGLWMMVDEGHICTLALRPEWRGRGLGELLLASLIEQAAMRQAAVVTLEVRVSNVRAQSLYAKYGFRVVGERKRYYTDNHEDALIMTTDPINADEFIGRFEALTTALLARLAAERDTPPPARLNLLP